MIQIKHLHYKEKSNSDPEVLENSTKVIASLVNQGWVIKSHSMGITQEDVKVLDEDLHRYVKKQIYVYHYSILFQR